MYQSKQRPENSIKSQNVIKYKNVSACIEKYLSLD